MITMHKKRAPIDPFNANLFQIKGSNAIRRFGIEVSPDLSKLTPFPKDELAKLKELEPQLQGIDVHKLPLLYTTQMPVSRGHLIDVASSEMFLAVPPANKNGNGGSASALAALAMLVEDFKSLTDERLNSQFLNLMVTRVGEELKNIKIDDGGDFLKQAAQEKQKSFEKLIADIKLVLQKMHENGMDGTSIYKKLTVDYDYLYDMQGFISNAIKKVQSIRLNLNKKYLNLERRQQNIEKALEKTETKNTLDQIISLSKWVFGTAMFSAATFLAAQGEALKLLQLISKSPNLLFIGIGAGLVGLGIFVQISMEMWKAFQKNHFDKIYEKRKKSVIQKATDYTHRNLKVIGYKATKEAAIAGYLESLQGEASSKYMAAAFQGDFDTINRIYDRQVDRMLGEHTFRYYFRRLGGIFRKNTERKMDSTLGKTAVEVDGSFLDVGLRDGEANAQP